MDYVTIDEFRKLDIRIGKIVAVEDHPNADKLYVITVDFGNEKRKIVSGIKPWYKKEDLLNKKIVVIVNLQPKNFRGIVSEGMLLAAEYENNLALLVPDKDIKEGAKVY